MLAGLGVLLHVLLAARLWHGHVWMVEPGLGASEAERVVDLLPDGVVVLDMRGGLVGEEVVPFDYLVGLGDELVVELDGMGVHAPVAVVLAGQSVVLLVGDGPGAGVLGVEDEERGGDEWRLWLARGPVVVPVVFHTRQHEYA